MMTMSLSSRMAPAVQAGIARLPISLSLDALEAGARRYARVALRTRWLPLFRNARAPAGPAPAVVEDQFVLTVLNWFDEVRPFALASASTIEIRSKQLADRAHVGRVDVVIPQDDAEDGLDLGQQVHQGERV
jgi:hypothetical protein